MKIKLDINISRKQILAVICLCVLVGSISYSVGVRGVTPPINYYYPTGWLHATGTNIYDSNNNLVQLQAACIADGQGDPIKRVGDTSK